ncbi:MAG: ATP-binding protein [Candidatus Obscuribacterales bacterium]|nr:ATP-binding protein [Candidatus Obscuribacterales bacterium]
MTDVLDMLETMAQSGTAPESGCHLFGVGYEQAFSRIQKVYVDGQFERGRSAEKFIVGPFGSGKTHFLRQLFELASDCNCARAEVHLNKDVDFTQRLIVYREVARAITAPSHCARGTGVRNLLDAAMQNIRSMLDEDVDATDFLNDWIEAIDQMGFDEPRFARQVKKALRGMLSGNSEMMTNSIRWLEGEVKDRSLAKLVGEQPISTAEENLYANRAMFSLFQFVKHAGFKGTIVGFDEAEQGFAVDRKKMQRILSMLQASINAVSDLKGASVLIVYALTPDVILEMEKFAALQQRVADPSDQESFFDGNTYAAKIDLTRRGSAEEELKLIALNILRLFLENYGSRISVSPNELEHEITQMAVEVATNDATSGNRRTMTKRVCQKLLQELGEEVVASGSQFIEPEV